MVSFDRDESRKCKCCKAEVSRRVFVKQWWFVLLYRAESVHVFTHRSLLMLDLCALFLLVLWPLFPLCSGSSFCVPFVCFHTGPSSSYLSCPSGSDKPALPPPWPQPPRRGQYWTSTCLQTLAPDVSCPQPHLCINNGQQWPENQYKKMTWNKDNLLLFEVMVSFMRSFSMEQDTPESSEMLTVRWLVML